MHELGTDKATGQPVHLSTEARRRHVYVVGKSGVGKTNLLHNFMLSDFDSGRGFCLIDPHGDEAERIADATPDHRFNDVIYLDPSDLTHAIAYNPLETVGEDERPLIAEQVLAAFAHVWGLSARDTPRLLHILRNALRLLLDTPGSTLIDLPRLLIQDGYRHRLLTRCTDPTVRMFWEEEFAGYSDRLRADAIAAIQNKAGAFVSNPAIRNILGQPHSTLHPGRVMDTGKVLICNFAKGKLGEDTSALLGALLTTGFGQAAQGRAKIPERERRDFTLYIDEFQNFTTGSFATILAEARKYRLGLVMAHQFMSQVPTFLQDAVIGTANTTIVFRVGARDAPLLASELGLENEIALKDLANFEAWVKSGADGSAGSPRLIRIAEAPGSSGRLAAIRNRAHARYARPREMVEYQIQRSTFATDQRPKGSVRLRRGLTGGDSPVPPM